MNLGCFVPAKRSWSFALNNRILMNVLMVTSSWSRTIDVSVFSYGVKCPFLIIIPWHSLSVVKLFIRHPVMYYFSLTTFSWNRYIWFYYIIMTFCSFTPYLECSTTPKTIRPIGYLAPFWRSHTSSVHYKHELGSCTYRSLFWLHLHRKNVI